MADQAEGGGAKANGSGKPPKRVELGRNAFLRADRDKRKRLDDERDYHKRQRWDNEPDAKKANPFTEEEIAAEERRPKRKVAVLVGYSGTGYRGMQINKDEKTIESDLFAALVAAGAISKANADDPRKSSLSRCARTDKGVHAAGNIISLKLIVEDPDVVERINAHLPPQIRVWGVLRTTNSFNCYKACDSRWYEYMLPSYALLPPHPSSFLWKKLEESARTEGKFDEFKAKLEDVWGFWQEVEEQTIKPILDGLDPKTRAEVLARLRMPEDGSVGNGGTVADGKHAADTKAPAAPAPEADQTRADTSKEGPAEDSTAELSETDAPEPKQTSTMDNDLELDATNGAASGGVTDKPAPEADAQPKELSPVDFALRDIKQAYIAAKRRYRVTPARLEQLQAALDQYKGTNNFHNYTVQKSFNDSSVKRHIRSFRVNPEPRLAGNTEWLSLKVHGQSFMMHQIRKMVGMAALVTRCATPLERIGESYGPARIAVPKAPGLGLWLERPVFAGYNTKATGGGGRDPIDFGPYEEKIREFKDREIYKRIFEVEAEEHTFHSFFSQVDSFRNNFFLWLTATGIKAASLRQGKTDRSIQELDAQLGDEDEDPEGGDG